MWRMRPAKSTILFKLKLARRILFIFGRGVISSLTRLASKSHYISHSGLSFNKKLPGSPIGKQGNLIITRDNYLSISLITPAPTVRPPSRMANRRPTSMAIGVINSALIDTLSPGITISTPSGSVTTPVTSVVRK